MTKTTFIAIVAAISISVPAIATAFTGVRSVTPSALISNDIVLAQTQGMDRRQERRDERQERRADRREKLEVTVDCGAIDVIMEEEQAESIAAVIDVTELTREEVANSICALVADFDPSQYEDPTNATIVTPSGVELFVEVQASQQ